MKQQEEKRSNSYLWESRQELYEFFQAAYGLSKAEVDTEIDAATKEFRLRKGQVINTRELWQKVGMSLERRLGATRIPTAPPDA